MEIILSAISQGIIWGILSIGLFISFRILNIADMTTEGSFTLGSVICVISIKNGINPLLSLIISIIFGMIAGSITGFLITYCKIPSLLSGILTMTGLISINLRIMGKPNVNLLNHQTIFELYKIQNLSNITNSILVGLVFTLILIAIIYGFFYTDIGQSIIATGDNYKMAESFGINSNKMIVFGLMISNGIIALSGGIIAQYNGFSDINSGIGTIVIALAGIIIGEVVFSELSFLKRLISIIYGSIIYRLILVLVLSLKFIQTNDFKLISAMIIALCLSMPTLKEKLKLKVRK